MPAEIAVFNPRKKRRKRSRKARRHVAKRRTHRRKRRSVVAVAAPRRVRRRRHNPRHVARRRHRRHNPRFSVRGIAGSLIPAAIGGAGAVALDIALGYAKPYLPDMVTTGYGKVAAQVAGAFGLGWLASKVVGHEKGKLVTMGALTVAAYTLVKQVVHQAAPTVPGLAGVGAYMQPQLGAYSPAPYLQGVGAYMPSAMPVAAGISGFDGFQGMDGFSDGM